MKRAKIDGRVDSAVNGRCGNGNAAGRVLTSRTSAMRRRWNGAASGLLAAALEASGPAQRTRGRNPSGGNRLDGHLAARAWRSGRTSRIHPQSIAPSSPQSVIVHVGTEHCAPSRVPVKLGYGQGQAQIRLVPRDDVDGLNSDEKVGSDDQRLSSSPAHNEAGRGHGLILFRPRVQHCHQQLANNRFHKTPLKSADNMKAPRSTR